MSLSTDAAPILLLVVLLPCIKVSARVRYSLKALVSLT